MNAEEQKLIDTIEGEMYRLCHSRKAKMETTIERIKKAAIVYAESQPTEQREASTQLSDEEAITAMFNRAEELELDLYKEEVEELYNVARDRTGGGVDLEDLIVWAYVKGLCTDEYVPHDYQPTFQEYLTQRNQQEKP